MARHVVERLLSSSDRRIIWGAPSYDIIETAWEEFEKMASGVADFNRSRRIITFPKDKAAGGGRATLLMRTLDKPKKARSKGADGVVLDEAAFIDHAVVKVLNATTLGNAGWTIHMTTPNGLNWWWEEFERVERMGDIGAAFQIPTVGCEIVNEPGAGRELHRVPHPLENPEIPWSDILELWEGDSTDRTINEEIRADFVDSGDAVFKMADILALESGWLGFAQQLRGHKYLNCWDIGRRQDATVGVTIDWTTQPWQLVAFERHVGLPYPGIQEAIEARHRAYGGRTIVESNGVGDPVIENLNVSVDAWFSTAKAKHQAITALQIVLERAAMKANVLQIINELKKYRWADENLVQDCVIALAIAAFHLPRPARTGGARLYTPNRKDRAGTIIGRRQTF